MALPYCIPYFDAHCDTLTKFNSLRQSSRNHIDLLRLRHYSPAAQVMAIWAPPGFDGPAAFRRIMLTVERELKSALGCDATIHMDPVETDNEQINAEHAALEKALKDVDGLRGIHDFRMVMGPSHTNLIFDVVMDTGCGKTPEQFRDIICRTVEEKLPGHFAVVTVDTSFVF